MTNSETDDFVEKVRERSDIYSVVSRYVPLTFKGGRYWACCPFHGEKTPSFTVTPDKGLFYCFGCHVGGNVFKFISMIENISYFEAVKLQAERLGIEIPSRKKTSAELEREREEKNFFKINELARDFYHKILTTTTEGEAGRKYLNARGITGGTIENFKLGFAPNSWNRLTNEFLKQGFTSEQLISVGLASKQKQGEKIFDRMRGRIIIPITNLSGRVVGFGGRILNSDSEKDSPKYLNTPETKIFNKGHLLFGLDRASKSILSEKFSIIVEGYMDAISLASAGVENVVATLGTAFTEEHAKLLTRYSRKIIFCYDSDEAGQRATVRALPIVSAAGANVSVVVIPDGKDPDEFIRRHGKEKFDALVKKSLPLFDYRLQYILKHQEHSSIGGKIDALRQILPVAVNLGDSTRQSEYRKKISAALFLDENIVIEEWQKFSSTSKNKPTEQKFSRQVQRVRRPSKEDLKFNEACEIILRTAWQENDLLSFALSLVPRKTFSELHQEIIAYLEKCLDEDRRPDDISAANELSERANAELSKILLVSAEDPRGRSLDAFEDSIRTAQKILMKKDYDDKLQKAVKLVTDGNPYADAMRETVKIKTEMDKLQ